jgi:transposase
MYVSILPVKKTGKHLMIVRESYRENGKVKQRIIKKLGYAEDYAHLYDDPIAHFKEEYKIKSQQLKEKKKKTSIEISVFEELEALEKEDFATNRKSLGAAALSVIYHQLELDQFVNNRNRSNNSQYNANAILKLLVYSRILFPGSKLSAYSNKGKFFEKMDFSSQHIYRFMDNLIAWKDDLFVHLNKKIIEKYNRDTTLLFYDVTNYYFEVNDNDELRRKGVSKEHRPNPIVQMGLFMDDQGIPVNYQLFPGNTNDCKTLIPMMGETRLNLDIRNIIIVGDKGMMSGENISRIRAQRNGYVISASIRGASSDFQKFVLDQEDYKYVEIPGAQRYESKNSILNDNGKPQILKIKDIVDAKRDINVPDIRHETTTKVTIKERQIFFYSEKYARKAKRDRQAALEKAKKIVKNNKKLNKSFGSYKYIKECYIKDDGELVPPKNVELLFDEKKLKEEEALDGYYVIFTNVIGLEDGENPFKKKSKFTRDGFFKLNKEVNAYDIIKMYRGLWEIEETFRITKSNLEVRPVYHYKEPRIDCHFLICFIALTIVRLLEKNVGEEFTTEEIIESLRKANGTKLENNFYIFDYFNKVLERIDETLGTTFNRKYLTNGEIKKIIAKTKKV